MLGALFLLVLASFSELDLIIYALLLLEFSMHQFILIDFFLFERSGSQAFIHSFHLGRQGFRTFKSEGLNFRLATIFLIRSVSVLRVILHCIALPFFFSVNPLTFTGRKEQGGGGSRPSTQQGSTPMHGAACSMHSCVQGIVIFMQKYSEKSNYAGGIMAWVLT